MSELLAEVHDMRINISGMRDDIKDMRGDIQDSKTEQAKTNLGIQELRLSVMRLADFGERILTLEKAVFKKAS